MPTIDDLAPAIAATDTDSFVVSQAGTVRKITRAQVLAGVQPALAVPGGMLLGGIGTTPASPQPIAIGANLSLTGNTLAAQGSNFIIANLPQGIQPAAADLVPIAQSGSNVAVGYANFMAGLANLSGIDLSAQSAAATGAPAHRAIADLFADSVSVESYGARGDGVTDDTAALTLALASGRPLRFGAKTYAVSGQWTINQPAILLGVPGLTILRRIAQSGSGAWIALQGAACVLDGIIFDANRAAISQTSWGVLVASTCISASITRCTFRNAASTPQGNGLTIQASYPSAAQLLVQGCIFHDNDAHGIWVQSVQGAQVLGCQAYNNTGYGICLDDNDPGFIRKLTNVVASQNRCWANARGISVGNFNATNTLPPVWGHANPDVIGALITGNVCHNNAIYGIAASGLDLNITGNDCSGNGLGIASGAGILANVQASRICDNLIAGASQFGIDAGAAVDTLIAGNFITDAAVGLNPGGGTNVQITGNTLQDCTSWAITIQNVEDDGAGNNFGLAACGYSIAGNTICLAANAGGIYILDAAQQISVTDNAFSGRAGAIVDNCLWPHSDTVVIARNSWTGSPNFICNPVAQGAINLVHFPDIADELIITAAPAGVQSLLSDRQVSTSGQLGFIKVLNGGSGYAHASVSIGGAGTGATATAIIANGAIIGIQLTNPGSAYGAVGSSFQVSISGDGSGALAQAFVSLPVLSGRRLRIICNSAVRFTRAGSTPLQDNWTQLDITAPAGSETEWVGIWGYWRASRFVPGDYFVMPGDGSLQLRNLGSGELQLHAAGAGHLRLTNDAEATGILSLLGRGAPSGVVAAPVGSEYRNLNGGAGATLWIKIANTDATGWVAIA